MNKAVRILVVEDDVIIGEGIRAKLAKLGYSVPALATTGTEAILTAEETGPDLIIMDIKLQGKMDGIEAAENIRSRFNIPVVYLSAYADEETVERAKLTEPFGYIVKPFESRELRANIVVALHKHKLEKELRDSEERYRIAIEHSNDGVTIVQGDHHVFVNRKFLDIFGYENKEEVLGKPVSCITHPDDAGMVLNMNRRRQRGESVPSRYELRGRKKTGETLYIEASVTKTEYNGKPCSLAYMRDITERKEAELEHMNLMQTIKQAKIEWEVTVETLPEIIALLDVDGNVVRSNYVVKESRTGTLQSAVGIDIHSLLHQDCSRNSCEPKMHISRALDRLWREDQVELEIDDPILNKCFFIRFRRVVNSKAECSPSQRDYSVAIIQDITERKRTEKELRMAYEELQLTQQELIQAERLAVLGKFSSGIAHELRNPLANMSASAQFCLNKYAVDEPIRKHLEVILRNSESANRIIKELLDLAKPSEISSKLGQVGDAINKVCDLVKTRCEKQRILIHKRWSRKLPMIFCDKERLEKAFLNIISNAIDAMPGGGRLSITAYFDKRNEEVLISFLDTGSGISGKDLENIFHPFFTNKKDGIGLGLCLTQQVINYHKGDIQVKSEVGKGTEVVVTLPISREHRIQKRKVNGKNINS